MAGLAITQTVGEGIGQEAIGRLAALAGLLAVIGTAGMFAIVMAVGGYLGLLRSSEASRRGVRAGSGALLAACASVPLTVAFREQLVFPLHSDYFTGSPQGLSILIAAVGLLVGLVSFLVLRLRS
jgi:hypothetical protein